MKPNDPDRTRVAVVDPLVGACSIAAIGSSFRLAAGGFGAIYRATTDHGDRDRAQGAAPGLATRARRWSRGFAAKAQALSTLRNPHTITAYEFGETRDGTLYIAMELLHGESLLERFRALGPLPWRRMVAIARAGVRARSPRRTRSASSTAISSRRTSTSRQRGGDPDFVKVLDFGIAKILHGSALDESQTSRAPAR